jgi:NAD-dependent dihydropyrimidine dehydrogenase PreA subunit
MPIIIDIEKCDGCGDCVDVCPTESIRLVQDKAHFYPEDCIDCDACVEACPNEAITMIEE